MRCTAARDALATALATLSRVVERRNTIPILGNVLLDAGEGRLTLTVTDLDIEAETSIKAETGPHADVTVPAHMLHEIVRKLPSGAQISLDAEAGDGRVRLRSDRARFDLQSLPAADFPALAADDLAVSFALPAKTLLTALDAVAFAISTEEVRYYLNGVYIHAPEIDGAPHLTLVATDGHRLARWRMPAPEGCAGMPGVILPRKAALEIARLAKEAGEGEAKIALSDRKLRVEIAGFTLTTKLIDGTFPDYQRVIPTGHPHRATARREDLAQAADRVCVVSSERGKAVKLAFGADTLTLSVRASDAGDAQDEVGVAYDGAPMEIGFNARYLADCLQTLGGDETELRLLDAGSPALLANPADAATLVVLMPMRA